MPGAGVDSGSTPGSRCSIAPRSAGTSAWARAGYAIVAERSWRRLLTPLILSLTLGLAPFSPEPHLVGKLRWLAGGAVGMGAQDYFDVVMHGAPFLWLLWTAVAVLRTPPRDA